MTQCESVACYHCRKSMNFQMEIPKVRLMFHNVNTIIQCHPRPGGIPVSSLNESSENSLFIAKLFRFFHCMSDPHFHRTTEHHQSYIKHLIFKVACVSCIIKLCMKNFCSLCIRNSAFPDSSTIPLGSLCH